MSTNTHTFNEEKFQELIVCVATHCANDTDFHSVKLNKMLFFSDFISFEKYKSPISGAKYIHKKHGPVASQMLASLERMQGEGAITISQVNGHNRVVAAREPKLDIFLGREINVAWSVIDWLKDKPESECSELSHSLYGWQCTNDGEEIPYGFALIDMSRKNEVDVDWSIKRIDKLGLA